MKARIRYCFSFFCILIVTACSFQTTPTPAGEQSNPGMVDTYVAMTLAEMPTSTTQMNEPSATEELTTPDFSEETPTPTATIQHVMMPGEGAGVESRISDTISGDTAHQGSANQPPGGDMFTFNLYERPFNSIAQDVYFPELDIRGADLGLGNPWMYTTIRLYGLSLQNNELNARYGIEMDLNLDGRGDWFILADAPFDTKWSTDRVQVWNDSNSNVGQDRVCYTDPPQDRDSYDTLYFDQGQGVDPDAAWVRYIPGTPPSIQIAFKYSMINEDDHFMWGVWADRGIDQASWFDYHDHFTYDEAGSPFPAAAEYYPIKAIAEVDNTCRWVYGFTPTGEEPCLCAGGVPTPTPTPEPTLTPTITLQKPASLGGYVFKDLNGNHSRDSSDGGFGGQTVRVKSGACPGGGTVATATTIEYGRYTVDGLVPGTYCVVAPSISGITLTPGTIEITLAPGQFRDNLNFGYYP
jgi:hypothetical protein